MPCGVPMPVSDTVNVASFMAPVSGSRPKTWLVADVALAVFVDIQMVFSSDEIAQPRKFVPVKAGTPSEKVLSLDQSPVLVSFTNLTMPEPRFAAGDAVIHSAVP